MNCCIQDLREKEVINLKNGHRLGFVSDVEINTCTGQVISMIIWGKSKLCGILGRNEDIKIPWHDIEVIGNDTILVDYDFIEPCKEECKLNTFDNIFKHR